MDTFTIANGMTDVPKKFYMFICDSWNAIFDLCIVTFSLFFWNSWAVYDKGVELNCNTIQTTRRRKFFLTCYSHVTRLMSTTVSTGLKNLKSGEKRSTPIDHPKEEHMNSIVLPNIWRAEEFSLWNNLSFLKVSISFLVAQIWSVFRERLSEF